MALQIQSKLNDEEVRMGTFLRAIVSTAPSREPDGQIRSTSRRTRRPPRELVQGFGRLLIAAMFIGGRETLTAILKWVG
jgi:hypothetical protein